MIIYVNEEQFEAVKASGVYVKDVNEQEYILIDGILVQKQKGYYTAEIVQEMLRDGVSPTPAGQ